MRRTAFTLIELLVVVAIIVALLAILMPSMGKAMHLATMTRCASNLKQTGYGYFNFAAEHFGRFNEYNLTKVDHIKEGSVDMRPALSPYIAFNELHCPLTDAIEYLKPPYAATQSVSWTYSMFAGYKMDGESKRLSRLGDYFEQAGRRFSVLAADTMITQADGSLPLSSHPGRGMGLYTAGANTAPVTTAATYSAASYTFIRWENSAGSFIGGETDLNFVFSDGAVRTRFTVRRVNADLVLASPFRYPSPWNMYLPTGN